MRTITTIAAVMTASLMLMGCDADRAGKPAAKSTDAHDGMNMAAAAPGDTPATRGFRASMTEMMAASPPYTGDPDVDFNRQMRAHHQAAVAMARVELEHGKDPTSRALATEIIRAQQAEIAAIDEWLAKRGG